MSGHLDGPPPGPPDPPYIPGDMGAPSAEEFARRRGSPPHGRDEAVNPYRLAREVENDALARMTGPSPREEAWDEGCESMRADFDALVLVAEQLRDALRKIAHGPNSAPTTIEPWSRAEALIALRAAAASGVLKDGGPADA